MLRTSLFPGKLSSVPIVSIRGNIHLKATMTKMELSITRPDDWHLHLREGELLEAVVSHSSHHFGRAIIMPNLKPPITTTAVAVAYRNSILKALPANSDFTPLMTLYLTDTTAPNEIKLARESGVVFAVKLYPAGATTNSQDGVTDLFGKCLPVLEEMVRQNMPLLVHGEVTSPDVDVFDREKVFIDTVLSPLIQKLPKLKVVMEHITTLDAVKFVESCDEGFVAATVTPQHLVLNRNSLFQGGLQPHNYHLPVLKREIHNSSEHVCIENSNISMGYDAVVLKSGWDEYGIAYGKPTSNVNIRGVCLKSSSGSGIAFGSEMSGGISNVMVEHLHVQDSLTGVQLKTARGRCGYIKGIYVSDAYMENVQDGIKATGQYDSHPNDKFDPDALPVVSEITFKDIVGVNTTKAGSFLGLYESPFTSICLSNISFSISSNGMGGTGVYL